MATEPPAAPVSRCDNCRRVSVPAAVKVGLFVEGRLLAERTLCSACRVHVTDELAQPAPWIGPPPKVRA